MRTKSLSRLIIAAFFVTTLFAPIASAEDAASQTDSPLANVSRFLQKFWLPIESALEILRQNYRAVGAYGHPPESTDTDRPTIGSHSPDGTQTQMHAGADPVGSD